MEWMTSSVHTQEVRFRWNPISSNKIDFIPVNFHQPSPTHFSEANQQWGESLGGRGDLLEPPKNSPQNPCFPKPPSRSKVPSGPLFPPKSPKKNLLLSKLFTSTFYGVFLSGKNIQKNHENFVWFSTRNWLLGDDTIGNNGTKETAQWHQTSVGKKCP